MALKMLKAAGCEVDVHPENEIIPQDRLISVLQKGNYDAVLCLLTDKIGPSVFDAAPTVKIYANYASGFDNIDIEEAGRRGIMVTNAPTDLSSEAVAEHAVALMLSLQRKIVEADKFTRTGKYGGWDPMLFMGESMRGRTLGLVGAGRIGQIVADICSKFGVRIQYTDVKRNEIFEKQYGTAYFSSLEELLQKSDIVSLHVPLLPSTRHLLDDKRLRTMKKNSILINTSRGPVVDEKALVRALRDKAIAGAALDVFEFEPELAPGLTELENVILTPHIASSTLEAREKMAEVAAQNIIDFLSGKKPANTVNT